MISTRLLSRATALAALALTLSISAQPVRAAAPALGTPAPGFQRMILGDFEITALSDGSFSLPAKQLLKNATPARIDATLGQVFIKDPVPTSVNAYLVNTGTKLVLIDTGSGILFGPTLGKLADNLAAAGYKPEQVDEIYLTHLHPDHVGGLTTPAGVAVFPNAIVRTDKRESDFWLSEAIAAKAPKDAQGSFADARKSMAPYVASGHFKPFTGASNALVPGVSEISTIGHTPGHSTYIVSSKGQRMVIWGDLVHVAALQFPDPDVAIAYDSDSKAAIAQRKRAFADAAVHGDWVAAAHMSFPGIGHVVKSGTGYMWIPVNYAPVINGK
jgi:glyoxylase-like metal-dependent hydrolase (beta-lactamase superfamily II)